MPFAAVRPRTGRFSQSWLPSGLEVGPSLKYSSDLLEGALRFNAARRTSGDNSMRSRIQNRIIKSDNRSG